MTAQNVQNVALLLALVSCQWVLWWASRPARVYLHVYGVIIVAGGLLNEFGGLRWATPVAFSVATVPLCIGAVRAVRERRAARSERV